MLLSAAGGSGAFALYAIGLQWFALALFLPGIVVRVILPQLVRSRRERTSEAPRLLVHRGLAASAIAGLVVAGLGCAVAPLVLQLYGEHYSLKVTFIAVFLAAAIPTMLSGVVGTALIAANRHWFWTGATLLWLVVLVAVAQALRDRMEWGSGFALLCANCILLVAGLAIGRRLRVL
jgi:O-antigen/teichoic acid export membrane protein